MRNARAVDRVPGREIVRAIQDDIAARDKLFELLPLEFSRKNLNIDFGIERREGLLRLVDFPRADGIRAVEDLALQVREIDLVGIGEGQSPDARSGEVERRRTAEAAGADDQRARRPQPLLSFDPDLGKKDVAAIAEELLVVQR